MRNTLDLDEDATAVIMELAHTLVTNEIMDRLRDLEGV
jgi:hypothetical protein